MFAIVANLIKICISYPIENRGYYLVAFLSAWSFRVLQGRTSPLVATLT